MAEPESRNSPSAGGGGGGGGGEDMKEDMNAPINIKVSVEFHFLVSIPCVGSSVNSLFIISRVNSFIIYHNT